MSMTNYTNKQGKYSLSSSIMDVYQDINSNINSKSKYYCNNCGKYGHVFQKCSQPINSYGIIAFIKHENQYKFLMICRKDSFGYTDFVRGKYSPEKITELQKKIDEMSNDEKNILLNFVKTSKTDQEVETFFEYLWKEKWGPHDETTHHAVEYNGKIYYNSMDDKQFKNEELTSLKKFITIKNGINYNGKSFNLHDLLLASKTNWTENEWEFPKGRRNYPHEDDKNCALREFAEETGIDQDQLHTLDNMLPYEELFIGTNGKQYKYNYYLAFLNISKELNNVDINSLFPSFQKNEVSKIGFKTLDECIHSIRPNCKERINLIKEIYNVLNIYNVFFTQQKPKRNIFEIIVSLQIDGSYYFDKDKYDTIISSYKQKFNKSQLCICDKNDNEDQKYNDEIQTHVSDKSQVDLEFKYDLDFNAYVNSILD